MNRDQSTEDTLKDAFKSADLGDRTWLFFTQHGRIFKLLAIAVVLCFGFGICIMIGRASSQKTMESSYFEVIRNGDGENKNRENFARKYATKPLGGFIFLELADEAYGKKEYGPAKDYYHRARRGLGKNIFAGRAAIGESVALIKSGMVSEGETLLARIGEERSHPPAIRGNALYFLAVSMVGRGDINAAKNILNILLNSNFSAHWKGEGKKLLREIGMER
ncbi:MAG: hypothetical protein LBN94_03315 [Puniceicoccales bacterium]|jgi:hypothetical protein|nr:hypothetical protein [Puniceicoccales bacterium]